MEGSLFDDVAEVVRSLVPDGYGDIRVRPRRYGVKVWFGPLDPPRHHYEAQVLGPRHADGAEVLVLEVGYHLEDPDADRNDAVLASLVASERRWRRALGPDAVAGPFLGRPDDWRRLSETWPDPDLADPGMALDIGARLIDYLSVLEPLCRPVTTVSR